MADDTLARVVHDTRREFAEAFERPMTPAPWGERHPRQQELDRHIALAVECAVRNQVASELRQMALHLVPGVARDALREAAGLVLRKGQERSDGKETQP